MKFRTNGVIAMRKPRLESGESVAMPFSYHHTVIFLSAEQRHLTRNAYRSNPIADNESQSGKTSVVEANGQSVERGSTRRCEVTSATPYPRSSTILSRCTGYGGTGNFFGCHPVGHDGIHEAIQICKIACRKRRSLNIRRAITNARE